MDVGVVHSLQLKKGNRPSRRLTNARSSSISLFGFGKYNVIFYLYKKKQKGILRATSRDSLPPF